MNQDESFHLIGSKQSYFNTNENDSNSHLDTNNLDDFCDPFPKNTTELSQLIEIIRYAVDQSMNIVITDIDGYILYVNSSCYELIHYQPDELIGVHTKIFNAGYHSGDFFKEMWETILSGEIWRGDVKNRKKDGNHVWVRMRIIPILSESGTPYQFVALREDITEKKEMEFQLALKDKQLSALTKYSYDVVGIIDHLGVITYQNPAFERVLGYKTTDTLGSNILTYLDEKELAKGKTLLNKFAKVTDVPINRQIRIKHKNGTMRWCDVALTNYLNDPHIQGIVFNIRDITKQKESSEIVNQIAYFDFLTGLPNRRHFEDLLKDTLQNAESSNRRVALLFLDLDGFKTINDTLGHEIGDGLLIKVAQRISRGFEKKAIIGRLGGDEFSIIIPNMFDFKYLHKFASSLVRIFNRPFIVEDFELNVSASIGISIYPLAGKDMKTLLKHADVAMYQAKKEGKNHYQLYSPSMDLNGYKAFLLKNDLKKALDEEQFFVVYQPRVNPNTHKLMGCEALIRWNHPIFGLVSPLEFIPYAEETGFIIPLGEWILTSVCSQAKEWQRQGLQPIKVSVNISAIQLLHPNFAKNVKNILKESGLEPEWLELEITETVLLNKEDQALKALEKLSSMGFTIALDDFGTGYSALNYLTKYKFDVIKIDRSILKNIPNDGESYEVANAIVRLAQTLKKKVVAEGIETSVQLALVAKMGCDEFQGYICSKPAEVDIFKKFLEDGKWNYKK